MTILYTSNPFSSGANTVNKTMVIMKLKAANQINQILCIPALSLIRSLSAPNNTLERQLDTLKIERCKLRRCCISLGDIPSADKDTSILSILVK